MHKFIAASISLIFGIVLGAVGIPLALWVVLALYRVERGFDWALWALERSPLPLGSPPVQLANDAIQREALVAAGLGVTVLCFIAFTSLRHARRVLRPADESHDGEGRIELKAQPLRVGRPVEGRILLSGVVGQSLEPSVGSWQQTTNG